MRKATAAEPCSHPDQPGRLPHVTVSKRLTCIRFKKLYLSAMPCPQSQGLTGFGCGRTDFEADSGRHVEEALAGLDSALTASVVHILLGLV